MTALPRRIATNLVSWCRWHARPPRMQVRPLTPSLAVVVALVLAVVVAAMFSLDTAASDWARHLPPSFRAVFEEITDFGRSAVFLYPLGVLLLLIAAFSSAALPRLAQGVLAALAARLGFLFIAIGAPSLFDTIVKRLIGRARPYVGGHDNPFLYHPFVWRPEYASMPSGHATTAAAAAMAIGAMWPRARPLMWLYALIILFSRIVVVAHHPSDVIAGALVGALGAMMVQRAFAARRLVFSASDLQPYPWPSWRRLKAVAVLIAGSSAPSATKQGL